ncbi:NAD(P)/FAD-dependent oxidoreductase, partial [Rhodoblastus sp.]|uniref:NAD(P)/FAD-dependent oxidoreductase n=1 Tax=Rhodoblastus sp. TaxID=1962975 RepID=UPI003F9ABF4A
VVAPLRQVLKQTDRCRFVMGRVQGVDWDRHEVICDSLSGERRFPFDHLVLAFGSRARTDFVPGLADHALPLKTIGDALEIRNTTLRRIARMELEADRDARALLGSFIVIGGGFSGVELGALIDCLESIGGYYPRADMDLIRVTLIQDRERLLPELPESLGEAAARSLRRRGVELKLGVRAVEASASCVALDTGERIEGASVISTIGTMPNPLIATMGLPVERGRIVVNPDLSVAGHPGVWALGDCALAVNAHDSAPCPPTAQFAVRQGRHLARNLLLSLGGKPTEPFRYRERGSLATVGHLNGVARVFGLSLTGLPAWLLWRAYYLAQMPTFGRKLRIFAEWTWGMFFPADITHFRFTKSKEL